MRVEYTEITPRKRRPPPKMFQPPPEDPEAVECSQHDGFIRAVYEMRPGVLSMHQQDKRYPAALRLSFRLAFWAVHKWGRT